MKQQTLLILLNLKCQVAVILLPCVTKWEVYSTSDKYQSKRSQRRAPVQFFEL